MEEKKELPDIISQLWKEGNISKTKTVVHQQDTEEVTKLPQSRWVSFWNWLLRSTWR